MSDSLPDTAASSRQLRRSSLRLDIAFGIYNVLAGGYMAVAFTAWPVMVTGGVAWAVLGGYIIGQAVQEVRSDA